MIEQGQCERCAALEREVEALKTEWTTYGTLTLSRETLQWLRQTGM